MNSFSTTWTKDSPSGAAPAGKGYETGDRGGGNDECQPPHATSFIRGILQHREMIGETSTSNHCSTSDE